MYRFFYYFLRFKKFCFFFNLRVTCVWNTRQKRGFLSVSVCCQQDAGHVRNPLCLRKIKETEYFYIFILTSTSLAAFNPTIRAFRTEISKHLPAKPGFFWQVSQRRQAGTIKPICIFRKPHYSYSTILNCLA